MSTATETTQTHLEDLHVGQRTTVPAGDLGPADPDGVVRGAQVAATFAGSPLATGEETESSWRYLAPVHAEDDLTFEVVVVGCHRTADRHRGVVRRHVRVVDADGVLRQEGTTTSLVPVREVRDDDADRVGLAVGTRAWATALAERLDADPAFTTETSTWDGTIGIRCGEHEAQFRVYRGRVLEAVRRTLAGPTFVVEACEADWIELITGPTNDFSRRAMLDQIEVRGNAYEYLRLTSALVALVDQARELAGSTEGTA
jgi:putative sterol carrier protein